MNGDMGRLTIFGYLHHLTLESLIILPYYRMLLHGLIFVLIDIAIGQSVITEPFPPAPAAVAGRWHFRKN